MSVLIGLPSALLYEIVDEWLPTNDIALFDTACCNRILRLQFLNELKQMQPIEGSIIAAERHPPKTGKERDKDSIAFRNRIFAKKLKLRRHIINSCFFSKEKKLLFNIDYSTVTDLIMGCWYDSTAEIDFINSCHNLTTLSVGDVYVEHISTTILCGLKKIHLHSLNFSLYVSTLEILNQHCKSLVEFNHEFYDSKVLKDVEVDKLLLQNSNLQSIKIGGSVDRLNTILDQYSNITSIDYWLPSKVHMASTFSKILKKKTNNWNIRLSVIDKFTTSFNYVVNNGEKTFLLNFYMIKSDIIDVFSSGHNLNSIELSSPVTDDILEFISTTYSKSLNTLILEDCLGISTEIWEALLRNCQQLTCLVLNHVDNDILKYFENASNKFKKISISYYLIEFHLSSVLEIIRHCPFINSLYVHGKCVHDVGVPECENTLRQHKYIKSYNLWTESCIFEDVRQEVIIS